MRIYTTAGTTFLFHNVLNSRSKPHRISQRMVISRSPGLRTYHNTTQYGACTRLLSDKCQTAKLTYQGEQAVRCVEIENISRLEIGVETSCHVFSA